MSGMKFLVVDDSPTMRRIVINTLKRIGYRDIVDAEHGQDGMEKLKTIEGITFVITDWNFESKNRCNLRLGGFNGY